MGVATFTRTERTLRGDRSPAGVIFSLAATALAIAWGCWFVWCEVPVVAASRAAELALERPPVAVAAPVAGTLVSAPPRIGARVRAGDLLAHIDATEEELERARVEAALARARAAVPPLEREIAALEQAKIKDEEQVAAFARERGARRRQRRSEAAHAGAALERAEQLLDAGAGTLVAVESARFELGRQTATLVAERHADAAELGEREHHALDLEARLWAARRELETLRADATLHEIELRELDHHIARKRLLSPIDGIVGSVADLRPGAVLDAGEPIATVIPDGPLVVRARFDAGIHLGRIREGLRGELRLDAFPAIEHGAIPVRVRAVALEARDGRLDVELELDARPTFPVHHGMTGVAEIVLETATPATLVLREVGLIDRSIDREGRP